MKNSVKRLLAVLMTATMTTGALTACGGSSASSGAAASAAGSAAASSAAASSAAVEEEYGPVLTRIKESGKMVLGTASGYMPYEFIDISSAGQDVIGVDMAMGEKIAEKLSEKLGVEVEMQIEDTTFTNTLAAIAADQVDIMIAGMSPTEER